MRPPPADASTHPAGAATSRAAAGRLLRRVDTAADGLAVDLCLYALGAAFALVTALTSTLLPHRAWGAIAAWAYLAAFLAALVLRSRGRAALTWAAWAGVALLPLVAQAVQRAGGRLDRAQEEVVVVEHSGQRLLDTGTPYLGADAIGALPPGEQLLGYLPYQPGMALFGLPRALAGDHWWTDARVLFALVTAGALVAAIAVLRDRSRPALVRAVQAVTVLPICALTLATGGDDLPVLALCLLALACCATDRFGAAGVAVGAAAALKLFALPVLVVLAVLAVATGRGRRFLVGAVLLPVLALVPALVVDRDAFVENVIRFPLGHGLVTSPAQSPFPGYLISTLLPGGRIVAAVLLGAVAVAIAVWLLRRPPVTAAAATTVIGYGLLAAILLMPTTRFGYLLYPIAFLIWAPAVTTAARSSPPPAAVVLQPARLPIDSDVDLHVAGQRQEVSQAPWSVLGAISVGGALGALGRFGLATAWPHPPGGFPWATFVTNVSGCLLIGILMVLITEVWPTHRLIRPFLGVGVLGGFTTFSTYTADVQQLVSAGAARLGLLYLAGTLAAALAAVAAGISLTRLLTRGYRRPPETAS